MNYSSLLRSAIQRREELSTASLAIQGYLPELRRTLEERPHLCASKDPNPHREHQVHPSVSHLSLYTTRNCMPIFASAYTALPPALPPALFRSARFFSFFASRLRCFHARFVSPRCSQNHLENSLSGFSSPSARFALPFGNSSLVALSGTLSSSSSSYSRTASRSTPRPELSSCSLFATSSSELSLLPPLRFHNPSKYALFGAAVSGVGAALRMPRSR